MTEKQLKVLFLVSLCITYTVLAMTTICISLVVGVWAPWWVYMLEGMLVALIGWDMTTWKGTEADMELP